jgi:hypothetical protein
MSNTLEKAYDRIEQIVHNQSNVIKEQQKTILSLKSEVKLWSTVCIVFIIFITLTVICYVVFK